MEVIESNFNNYYTTLALRLLEDKINRQKQYVHEEKLEMQWLISNDGFLLNFKQAHSTLAFNFPFSKIVFIFPEVVAQKIDPK